MTPARVQPDMETYSGRASNRLRELRDKAELTAEEITKRLTKAGYAIQVPKYYHWESGRSKIDLDAIPALVKVLKTKTVGELLPRK